MRCSGTSKTRVRHHSQKGNKMYKTICLMFLCVWLAGCDQSIGEPKVAGRWYTPSQVELGKKVYAENCISCHNENARGTFSWRNMDPSGNYPPPPLNGTAHAWHHPLKNLTKTIEQGGIPLGGKMPGFGAKLKDEEVFAVISYFQSFWSEEIYDAWLKRGGLK
jgi:mono/diheme cytochrome c family protein